MKQVKCPYCKNIQEATYDKRTADLEVAEAIFKILKVNHITVCTCKKCGKEFKELENKVGE